MSNMKKVLLGLLFAIASSSTLVRASDCANPGTPSWVHDSEAYQSSSDKMRTRADVLAEAPKAHESRRIAGRVVQPRSPFRDDTGG